MLCRTVSPESRKLVKWHCEDALGYLRKSERGTPTFEDYMVRLVSYSNWMPAKGCQRGHISPVVAKCTFTAICARSLFQERLAHLKRQCQPHLTQAVKSSVEGICTKIYNQSCESAKKITEKHWAVLKDYGISRECVHSGTMHHFKI